MTLEEYNLLPYRDLVVIFNCFGVVGIKFDIDNKPIKDSSYIRNDLMYSTDFYTTIIK
jgi:hypothetical protein